MNIDISRNGPCGLSTHPCQGEGAVYLVFSSMMMCASCCLREPKSSYPTLLNHYTWMFWKARVNPHAQPFRERHAGMWTETCKQKENKLHMMLIVNNGNGHDMPLDQETRRKETVKP